MLKLSKIITLVIAFMFIALPASAKTEKITLQIMQPSNQPISPVFEKWAKTLNEKSNGGLDVKIIWNAGITGVPGAYAGLRDGALDIAGYSTGWNMKDNPYSVTAGLPYATTSAKHATQFVWELLKTPEYGKEANKDMKLLAAYGSGLMCLASNNSLIRTPADLKGKRVLFMGGATMAKEIEIWGATPVIVGTTDIYAALQRGLGEVFYGSFPNVKNLKLFEVAKYYTLFSNPPAEQRVGINYDLYNSLTEDMQKLIVETSGYELSLELAAALASVEKTDAEFLKTQGCEVLVYDAEQTEVFAVESRDILLEMIRGDFIKRGVADPDTWIKKAYELAESIQ